MRLTTSEARLYESRRQKLDAIAALGIDTYPRRYDATHSVAQAVATFSDLNAEQLEPIAPIRVSGRLGTLRTFGKATFSHISDGLAKLQVYIKKNELDDKAWEVFQQLDTGDLVGVSGTLFRTKTGELTVLVKELAFLAKCLMPLPEKWHGLTDVEIRYRQRYLDLIVNPDVRRIFEKRSRILQLLRRFLDDRGFLEVETPMMHPIVGGASARPFVTHHNTLDMDLFLRIAPELYLKRLVVGGMERVYEVNRNFRNEGISVRHNPEFTMLEFYQAYANYRDLIELTKELFRHLAEQVNGSLTVRFKDMELDFGNWQEFTLREAIVHFWDRGGETPTLADLDDRDRVLALLRRAHAEHDPGDPLGKLLGSLFEEIAEPHLIQPTFITEYPIELSPLSKKSETDPAFVDRFELYMAGMEVANAYSELNDPVDQEQRFLQQVEDRQKGDDEAQMMDEDYVRALSFGMPPTGGEGIGIDRLVMIFTDSPSIRDVILFPQMRPPKNTLAGVPGEDGEEESAETPADQN